MKPAIAELHPTKPAHGHGEVSPIHRVDEDALLGQFIPLHYHGQMLANDYRMDPFHEALEKRIPLGSHVVELGGGTGVMSFLASKRARKVTMIERLPHVAAAARRLLAANHVSNRVTVVEGDACDFVPDEPADVVICEMLHAALLREKQIQTLKLFKSHHLERFGCQVPRFIPEATILAIQPIYQPYTFHGYYAPVPFFFEAGVPGTPTVEMGEPSVYSVIEYTEELPESFIVDRALFADRDGTVNAIRFITKAPVGIFQEEGRSADWHLPYMCLPLPWPLPVTIGDQVRVRFQYDAGDSIASLQSSLQAALV